MAELDAYDLLELADEIRIDRKLPYTLTIEKVEHDIIYTHNVWGNSVRYRKVTKGFELLPD